MTLATKVASGTASVGTAGVSPPHTALCQCEATKWLAMMLVPNQYMALGNASRSSWGKCCRRWYNFSTCSISATALSCSGVASKCGARGLVTFGPIDRTTAPNNDFTIGRATSSQKLFSDRGAGSMSPPKANKQRCAKPTGCVWAIFDHQFWKYKSCWRNMSVTFVGSMCSVGSGGTGAAGLRIGLRKVRWRSNFVEWLNSSPCAASRKNSMFTNSWGSTLPPLAAAGARHRPASEQYSVKYPSDRRNLSMAPAVVPDCW